MISLKLEIKRSGKHHKVYYNGKAVAVIKGKFLSMDKEIQSLTDNECFYTTVSNAEVCCVYDEEKNEIVRGIIKEKEETDFKKTFFENPDTIIIELGEDSYIVEKERGDCLLVKKQEVDNAFVSDVALVDGVSRARSSISSETELSVSTLVVIYVFAKYLYDSKMSNML